MYKSKNIVVTNLKPVDIVLNCPTWSQLSKQWNVRKNRQNQLFEYGICELLLANLSYNMYNCDIDLILYHTWD